MPSVFRHSFGCGGFSKCAVAAWCLVVVIVIEYAPRFYEVVLLMREQKE
jgi:hypothetical protein